MKIIFLTYVNRSGSTYLSQILSCSNQICVCPEADLLVNMLLEDPSREIDNHWDLQRSLEIAIENDNKLKYWNLDELDISRISTDRTHLDAFCTILNRYRVNNKPHAEVILFKSERLIHLVPLIRETMVQGTEFQFVALLRDPRGVILSQKMTRIPGTDKPMTDNPGFTSVFWKEFARKSREYRLIYDVWVVRFEDLIVAPENTLVPVVERLGIRMFKIIPDKGDLFERIPVAYREIHKNITKSPIAGKLTEWQNVLSLSEIDLIESITRSELLKADYSLFIQEGIRILQSIRVPVCNLEYFFRNIIGRIIYKTSKQKLKEYLRYFIQNLKQFSYWISGQLSRNRYSRIRTYCLFIGYARSGHSILGAMLDAHPDACISIEADVLNMVRKGFNRKQIYHCIFRNSYLFTKVLQNEWTGYSYKVPRQFQGRTRRPFVIGDKKGNRSTLWIGRAPDLIKRLRDITATELKILHVIRHPLDNISTMVTRHLDGRTEPVRKDFERRIFNYFRNAEINNGLIRRGDLEILDIYHENFIANPVEELRRILDFLGLEPKPDYIKACAGIVYTEPHRSREELAWPEDLKKSVLTKMKEYAYLTKYLTNDG